MIANVLVLGALAGPPSEVPAPDTVGRNTARVVLGGAAAVATSFPTAYGDPGPALSLAKPFWLGPRKRAFQWVFDGNLIAMFGTNSGHVHLSLAPRFGFDILIGRVYGMEFRFGPGGALQAGARTVPAVDIMAFSFAHSFRITKDDDHRLKVGAFWNVGFYTAPDPGNDLATNHVMMGVGLGWETPYRGGR